jgi:hypothetical protein
MFASLPPNTLKNLRVNIALPNPTAARSMASNSSPADLIDSTNLKSRWARHPEEGGRNSV